MEAVRQRCDVCFTCVDPSPLFSLPFSQDAFERKTDAGSAFMYFHCELC